MSRDDGMKWIARIGLIKDEVDTMETPRKYSETLDSITVRNITN